MIYLDIGLGLVLLVAGGELLVRGAVSTARRFGVSPLLIGLTLVGFGTSTPELVTSIQAALVGSPGIAVGNVVGSNIANIFLILGLAALIVPVTTSRSALRRDGTFLLIATAACVAVTLSGAVDRVIGAAFVAALATYVIYCYRTESKVEDELAKLHKESAASVQGPRGVAAALMVVAGLALTILGARFLVTGAIELAQAAGISETVIGLTIVAVGTSLPELVTSIVAAIRRHSDIAFGNIIGSNAYNIFGILGVTALVQPIAVPPEIAVLDIWVMVGATLMLLFFAVSGWRVTRFEGALLLGGYITYVGYLISNAA